VADGPAPETAATAASTNTGVDDAGEAADGVAAEAAATAAGELLQHAERVDDNDVGDDAPARTYSLAEVYFFFFLILFFVRLARLTMLQQSR
jgi:hypothetical protein